MIRYVFLFSLHNFTHPLSCICCFVNSIQPPHSSSSSSSISFQFPHHNRFPWVSLVLVICSKCLAFWLVMRSLVWFFLLLLKYDVFVMWWSVMKCDEDYFGANSEYGISLTQALGILYLSWVGFRRSSSLFNWLQTKLLSANRVQNKKRRLLLQTLASSSSSQRGSRLYRTPEIGQRTRRLTDISVRSVTNSVVVAL